MTIPTPTLGNWTGTYSDPTRQINVFGNSELGFSPFVRSLAPVIQPGTVCTGPGDVVWVYAQATAVIGTVTTTESLPAACAVTIVPASGNIPATATIGAGATYKAFGPFAVGEWGYVLRNAALV
jgi:hypothetical protein